MFTPPRPLREFLLADDGSATVEYVIGMLAAAAFAAALVIVVKGDGVLAKLRTLVDQALSVT